MYGDTVSSSNIIPQIILQDAERCKPHMDLTVKLLRQIDDPALDRAERARLRCRAAKELEDSRNYEAAREALGELWHRIGERPAVDGLDRRTAAEVLLRAGSLTGWI